MIYVYAVGRRNGGGMGEQLTGVGSSPAPVRSVAVGDLAAVVSDVPADWRAAGRADLEAHDRVVSALLGHAVVPLRFGVVMGDDDEVREVLLARHAGELEALLTRLEGRVQMSVKAYYRDDDALLRAVVARRPDLKRPVRSHTERIDLGREVAAEVVHQRALDEHELVAPLAQVADDVSVDPGRSEQHLCTIQLLIDASRRDRLDAAVQRLGDERFALRYVGPVAPYSFCALEVGAWA